MTGRASRDKGARGEREIANRFKAAGFGARRAVGQFASGSDLPDVETNLPLWVEVKRGARTNIRAALRQAEEASGTKNLIPVAITRDDNEKDAVASLRFAHYLDLLRRAYPDAVQGPEVEGRAGGVRDPGREDDLPGDAD